MAGFVVHGMDELQRELRGLELSDEEKTEILTAGGTVLLEEQVKTAREMGIYDRDNDSRHAVDAMGLTKVKLTDDGGKITVTAKGTRKDKKHKKKARHAEVLFVNNYGRKGQAARPFVSKANARAEERLQQVTQATFDKWHRK